MPLNRLKESLPLETAKFAVTRGIDDEPAFKWWVPYTLRRRDRITYDLNKRISRTIHTHDVELQTLVTRDKKPEKKNGNTLWMDAIIREIENLNIAFDILEDGVKIPVN